MKIYIVVWDVLPNGFSIWKLALDPNFSNGRFITWKNMKSVIVYKIRILQSNFLGFKIMKPQSQFNVLLPLFQNYMY